MSRLFPHVLTNRNRRSRLYPYSAASIGRKIGVIHGRDCWWEAVGPALCDFSALVPEIKKQLDTYCEAVPGSDWITFSVYMIGREEQTATPTIMFFSTDSGPRKSAMEALKKGGVLRRYPGFKTGNRALPPDVDSLVQPAIDQEMPQNDSPERPLMEVYYDVSKPIRAFGMAIFIKHGSNDSTSVRAATANALRYGDQLLFHSVSHAFKTNSAPNIVVTEDYDSDYEIASETDDEFESDEDCDITSKGSLSPENASENTLSDEEIADDNSVRSYSSLNASTRRSPPYSQRLPLNVETLEDLNEPFLLDKPASRTLSLMPTASLIPVPENLAPLGSLLMSSSDKDWALIAITNQYVLTSLIALDKNEQDISPKQVAPGPQAAHIFTRTLSGECVSGTLSETPLYTRLPNSKSFQEVYKVQLNSALVNGDCGSAIVDARTSDLYGHIVAGCKITGIAYIMAAYNVFKEMEERLSGPLFLDYQDGCAGTKACIADHLGESDCTAHHELYTKPDKDPKLESHRTEQSIATANKHPQTVSRDGTGPMKSVSKVANRGRKLIVALGKIGASKNIPKSESSLSIPTRSDLKTTIQRPIGQTSKEPIPRLSGVINPPDPVSFLTSTLALADLGCKLWYAHEEIGVFRDIIASTSDLVSELKNKLGGPVACHLPSDDKAWICGKVQQAEVLLAKVNKMMKGMDKVGPQKRFRWVFQKRGVAESYKRAIFQCHIMLSQIRSSLIEMQNQGYGHVPSWMESERLPPSRQIANAPWEHSGLSNPFLVSSSCARMNSLG